MHLPVSTAQIPLCKAVETTGHCRPAEVPQIRCSYECRTQLRARKLQWIMGNYMLVSEQTGNQSEHRSRL